MKHCFGPNRDNGPLPGGLNLESALRVEVEIATSVLRVSIKWNAFRGTAWREPNDGSLGHLEQESLESGHPAPVFKGHSCVAIGLSEGEGARDPDADVAELAMVVGAWPDGDDRGLVDRTREGAVSAGVKRVLEGYRILVSC